MRVVSTHLSLTFPGLFLHPSVFLVCRLRRTLYGLKQSPRAWFGKFSDALLRFGLQRCRVDHSVFSSSSGSGCTLLIVYVDDIIITGSDADNIHRLKLFLQSEFCTKDLGRLRYFLGIEVAYSGSSVSLSQRKYTLDILDEVGYLGVKPADSPMDPNDRLDADQGDLLHDPARYRRLVGKLNYLTVTRPDISFAVSTISQFLSAPRTPHWNAALRIVRYLKKAPGRGLLFTKQGKLDIQSYSDADWAGCPIDRRSITGYCVFLGGNLVSWKSKKQHVVSRSSAEAEYRAMANTVSELTWLKMLLSEIGLSPQCASILHCDSQSAIHIASNPVFHERTKHIEVDCHFVREKIQDKVIELAHTRTEHQLADIFTKALRGTRVSYLCTKLGLSDIYAPT